ncbi:hypothetical protein WN943_005941 [Citrus x changshan-huyou]
MLEYIVMMIMIQSMIDTEHDKLGTPAAAAAFTSLFSSADQTTYRGALNKKLRHTNSSYLDFIRWVSFREADQDLNTEHPPSDEQ